MQRKAARVLWTIILLLLVLSGLGVAATVALSRTTRVGLARTVVVDGDKINSIAENIAHIDLPPGYAPEFGMRGLGFAMASYSPTDKQGHLTLVQIPAWLPMDDEAIIRRARASLQEEQQGDVEITLTVVEEREIDLGDHAIFYSIAEGTNDEGVDYRTMQLYYPGRNGKVALLLEEPVSRWDDARAQALLASLR